MRATLEDARLARYAGRFVWLELDFDQPANQEFLRKHGVAFTPTMFIIDPVTDRATATQMGGLTLAELDRFLEHGEHDAISSRAFELVAARKYHEAADLTVAEAPGMKRDEAFARTVLAGLNAVGSESAAPWAQKDRVIIEPLAAEALKVPGVLRDHRFQLYQDLMIAAALRHDNAALLRFGDQWLAEIDTTRPKSDDERSALDIARVDAADLLGQPVRVLPALIDSERAMPNNYNASLRLAQMFVAAKRYDEAVAACNRGLLHVTGPLGRMWILQTQADALAGKRDFARERTALDEALAAAHQIGMQSLREKNVAHLTQRLKGLKN